MIEQFHEDESWRDEIIDIKDLPIGYDDKYRIGPRNKCHDAYLHFKEEMKSFKPSQEPILVKVPHEKYKDSYHLYLYYLSDEN